MNKNTFDAFDPEFRHDVIVKFIKDIIDGRIKIPRPKSDTHAGQTIISGLVKLSDDIENLVSNTFTTAEQRNKAEFDIFSEIVLLSLSDRFIREKNASVYDEIDRLHNKIDSSNNLLATILMELQNLNKK